MDEFDEREVETIVASHYYDDGNRRIDGCDGIDEYDDICRTDSTRSRHYHQHAPAGSGCLIIVMTGIVFTICTATLLTAAV